MSEVFTPTWDECGNPMAEAQCTNCSRKLVFHCKHYQSKHNLNNIMVRQSDAFTVANKTGWAFFKEGALCDVCERERVLALKTKEAPVAKEPTVITMPPPAAPPVRQPTRDQKRLIVSALEESYDTKNQRYKGTETDKGIADMLADGIMSGWVAAVREDMFGPDGNEEMTDLASDVKEWMKRVDLALSDIQLALGSIELAKAEVKKYQDRLNKIVIAIGPKAEKVA